MTTSIAISQEQLDRCHRILDENTGKVFYQVESESDPTVEYEVRFTRGRGFSCTCPAGRQGFRNCRSTCKHCRWAAAHAEGLRQEKAEQGKITHLVNQGVSREVASLIVYADDHPYQYTEAQIKSAQYNNQRQAFSILR